MALIFKKMRQQNKNNFFFGKTKHVTLIRVNIKEPQRHSSAYSPFQLALVLMFIFIQAVIGLLFGAKDRRVSMHIRTNGMTVSRRGVRSKRNRRTHIHKMHTMKSICKFYYLNL